jgi:hypothetical protein
MLSISKRNLLCLLLIVSLNLGLGQNAFAYEKDLIKNFATLKLNDNGPVTTPVDVRFSLWRMGDPESREIDQNGVLVTSDENYGGWQKILRMNPDSEGILNLNFFDATLFPDFPEIFSQSAFMQIEYKYPGEPDTAYHIIDMLSDNPDNIKRYLLVNSLTSLDPVVIQGGTTNNDFILDVNYNAPQYIRLFFGQDGKGLIYDLISKWFNLDGRLNLNGFAGIKLAINAHANDSETQLFSIRNSSGSPVMYVDEDGDLTASSLTLPAGSGSSAPISRHLSVTAVNVVTPPISAGTCGNYATIAVPGAVPGDTVLATPVANGVGIETENLNWNALVSSANNVVIRACNPKASDSVNSADTQTWRVDVWGH